MGATNATCICVVTPEDIIIHYCYNLLFIPPPVTGSEDGMVYFFDIEKGTPFNKLSAAGKSVPILDVCWAYDESILASSDSEVRI